MAWLCRWQKLAVCCSREECLWRPPFSRPQLPWVTLLPAVQEQSLRAELYVLNMHALYPSIVAAAAPAHLPQFMLPHCAGQIIGDDNVRMLNRVRRPRCCSPLQSTAPPLHSTIYHVSMLQRVRQHAEPTSSSGQTNPAVQFDPTSAGTGSNYRWWDEGELRELSDIVGLIDFQRTRRLRFIMFSVRKPMSNSN